MTPAEEPERAAHPSGTERVTLRPVIDADLEVFFEQERDSEAVWMAAFTPKDPSDRAAFDEHWSRILADPDVSARTVLCGDVVTGHVVSFVDDGRLEVTYRIGREHWGHGLATAALRAFLASVVTARPIYARAAKDNIASLRVLEKCGFAVVGEDLGFANARGGEVEEYVLQLAG